MMSDTWTQKHWPPREFPGEFTESWYRQARAAATTPYPSRDVLAHHLNAALNRLEEMDREYGLMNRTIPPEMPVPASDPDASTIHRTEPT